MYFFGLLNNRMQLVERRSVKMHWWLPLRQFQVKLKCDGRSSATSRLSPGDEEARSLSTPTATHQGPLQQPLYPISTTQFYCLRSMHMIGNRDCSCPSVFLLVLLINCLSQTTASQSWVCVLLAACHAEVLRLPVCCYTYGSYQIQFYTCQRMLQTQRSLAFPKCS